MTTPHAPDRLTRTVAISLEVDVTGEPGMRGIMGYRFQVSFTEIHQIAGDLDALIGAYFDDQLVITISTAKEADS